MAKDRKDQMPVEPRLAMTWAQRMKCLFSIDIESYHACGGAVRIIACIEGPMVIEKILSICRKRHPAASRSAAIQPSPPRPADLVG